METKQITASRELEEAWRELEEEKDVFDYSGPSWTPVMVAVVGWLGLMVWLTWRIW